MTSYAIKIERRALKALKKIHPVHRSPIEAAIDELADEPHPSGVRKIQGAENTWRIRIGNYRVLYDIYDDELIIWVVRIAHRKDAY
jgi:mRNA interferase RelE/StbE